MQIPNIQLHGLTITNILFNLFKLLRDTSKTQACKTTVCHLQSTQTVTKIGMYTTGRNDNTLPTESGSVETPFDIK